MRLCTTTLWVDHTVCFLLFFNFESKVQWFSHFFSAVLGFGPFCFSVFTSREGSLMSKRFHLSLLVWDGIDDSDGIMAMGGSGEGR